MPGTYDTSYRTGQDNLRHYGLELHNPVFWISGVLVILFLVGTLIAPNHAKALFDGARGGVVANFDWLFMLAGNVFVLFCLLLVILPVGRIRIGGADAKPQFSTLSWFSMLFAAGMGIGLMYWSVAEPAAYYTNWAGTPLDVAARTPEAARLAMGAVLFHWGLHPWAIYAVVGLTLAFFAYNKGLPLTIRSGFYPILKDRVWGWPGHVIDILAVIATIFGLATSLGFGAQQAAGGIAYLFGLSGGFAMQLAVIVVVTALAVVSVARGLDGGVKVLSIINMMLAGALLVFVVVAGPTWHIIETIATTTWSYASNIVALATFTGREDEKFYHGWTVFYWAWWISWSPFVGMFIARISKGRTVREFIIAVLLVPTLVTIVWMSAFGGTALYQIENSVGVLSGGIGDVSLALFQMLENLPFAAIASFIAIVLVLVFFITSSDSGSLVVDSITAGGKIDSPVVQRIFWAIMKGAIAAVLLFGGGADALGALQAAAIVTGLPFAVVLLVMCVGLMMGLRHEQRHVLASPTPSVDADDHVDPKPKTSR